MQRITTYEYAKDIGDALASIPKSIRQRLRHVEFLCETDPAFAGLLPNWESRHPYEPDALVDAACCYPSLTSDRTTTIVLRRPIPPVGIVHELGHALHHTLGFEHRAVPVTDYARNSHREAFAEAFTTWLWTAYGDEETAYSDVATTRLFERLAEGDFSLRAL